MEIKTFPSIYLPQQGDTRIRTGDGGFVVLCLTAWLCRRDMGMPLLSPNVGSLPLNWGILD
jgi:hypothetical protein